MKVLILSDIHANLEALESALQQTDYDRIWVLGDLVGYGACPNEVVEAVRRLEPAWIVRGNHDKVCCGLADPDNFTDLARESALWTRDQLTAESREYLRGLPRGPVAEDPWAISHGSPLDEDEYLMTEAQVWMQMTFTPQRICFFGHTHVPILYSRSGRMRQASYVDESMQVRLEADSQYFINPGSIGQPRDGDPRGCLAVLETESASLQLIKFHYPLKKAAQRILQADLPDLLAQRLYIGR